MMFAATSDPMAIVRLLRSPLAAASASGVCLFACNKVVWGTNSAYGAHHHAFDWNCQHVACAYDWGSAYSATFSSA
eukprot:scaffold316609_cov18-Tisochrysis_lutea.AAC.1